MKAGTSGGAARILAVAALAGVIILAAAPTQTYADQTDLFNVGNRFLDGHFPKAALVPSTTVIDSFEVLDQVKADWVATDIACDPSEEHATEGKHSLKVSFLKPSSRLRYRRGTSDWAGDRAEQALAMRINYYDEARLDVFNPGPAARIEILMGKKFVFDLAPGANTLVMSTAEMRDAVFRATMVLSKTQIGLAEMEKETTLYFDNFRWIGPGLGENLIKHARCFDFGSSHYVRPHFLLVDDSAYSRERGYGWQTPPPERAGARRKMGALDYSARRPDDELLRDYVRDIHTPFLVDLPDGKYRMHLVEAYGGFDEPLPSFGDLSVSVDGGKPHLLRRGARSIEELVRFEYGREKIDYVPGEDKWAKYRAHIFRPLEHDFEVKGGQARFDFIADPPNTARISFLIVYPLDRAAVIEPEIAALWQDIRRRFNEVFTFIPRDIAQEMHLPGMHEEYLSPETVQRKKEALNLAEADRRRGYVLFRRTPIDEVYPDSVPSPEEVGDAFTTFGPRDETETVPVNLFALRDLKGLSLEVGDFVGPNGAKIARERIDVWVVKSIYRMAAQQSHGDWRYVVMPWYLVKRDRLDAMADTAWRYWINVRIPDDAPAGIYTAQATLAGANIEARRVVLSLEVLPFKLDPVPQDVEYSVYLTSPYQQPVDMMLAWFPARWRQQDSARWAPLCREAPSMYASRLRAEFDMIRDYGFNTVYYFDYRRFRSVELAPEITHGVKVVEGSADPERVKLMYEKTRFLSGVNELTEVAASDGKRSGLRVILNNYLSHGFGGSSGGVVDQEGGVYRFLNGFFLWRIRAHGCMSGCWQHYYGDPYHPFDGHCSEMGDLAAQASEGWPALNPSLLLEGAREGMKDYRYLTTLERLAAERVDAPAAEARDYLKKLRDRIEPNASRYFQHVGGARHFLGAGVIGGYKRFISQKAETSWKGDDYRRTRREIADRISRLR